MAVLVGEHRAAVTVRWPARYGTTAAPTVTVSIATHDQPYSAPLRCDYDDDHRSDEE